MCSSDLLPILLYFVEHMGSRFRARLVLRYWQARWVDVTALFKQLKSDPSLRWTSVDLMVLLVLGVQCCCCTHVCWSTESSLSRRWNGFRDQVQDPVWLQRSALV